MKNKNLKRIISIIADNSIGSVLVLDNKKITDEQIIRIAKALKNNRTVEKILLSSNLITDASVIALLECLKFNKKIKEIDLTANNIKNAQLIFELKRKLKTNKQGDGKPKNTNAPLPKMRPMLTSRQRQTQNLSDSFLKDQKNDLEDDALVKAKKDHEYNLSLIEKHIGYKFIDEALFITARTVGKNKKLESLGDALLDVIAALNGFNREEACRNKTFNDTKLATMLEKSLIYLQSNGHTDQANALEALVGAVFRDAKSNHIVIERMFFNILLANRALRTKPNIKQLGVALRKYACVEIALENGASKINDSDMKRLTERYQDKLLDELVDKFLNTSKYNYSAIVQYVKMKMNSPVKMKRAPKPIEKSTAESDLLTTVTAVAVTLTAGLCMWEKYKRDSMKPSKKTATFTPEPLLTRLGPVTSTDSASEKAAEKGCILM